MFVPTARYFGGGLTAESVISQPLRLIGKGPCVVHGIPYSAKAQGLGRGPWEPRPRERRGPWEPEPQQRCKASPQGRRNFSTIRSPSDSHEEQQNSRDKGKRNMPKGGPLGGSSGEYLDAKRGKGLNWGPLKPQNTKSDVVCTDKP